MTKTILNLSALFIVLVLLQAVVFNNLILFNCAIALVFIYLIIVLPVNTRTNMALTIGFLLGLSIDVFSDTAGMNSLACTILAFIRKPIYHLYAPRDEDITGQRPSIKTMGLAAFLKYAFTMSIIYCTTVFIVEACSFFDINRLLLRIAGSTVYTFVMIYAFESLSQSKKEKKN